MLLKFSICTNTNQCNGAQSTTKIHFWFFGLNSGIPFVAIIKKKQGYAERIQKSEQKTLKFTVLEHEIYSLPPELGLISAHSTTTNTIKPESEIVYYKEAT